MPKTSLKAYIVKRLLPFVTQDTPEGFEDSVAVLDHKWRRVSISSPPLASADTDAHTALNQDDDEEEGNEEELRSAERVNDDEEVPFLWRRK